MRRRKTRFSTKRLRTHSAEGRYPELHDEILSTVIDDQLRKGIVEGLADPPISKSEDGNSENENPDDDAELFNRSS